jgi:hypothetical protein
MSQQTKYPNNWKSFTPPIYKGEIIQFEPERGTGTIKTSDGEELFFKHSVATYGMMQVGYYVTFGKLPFIHQQNKFYAVNVKRAYLSQDGFYVIDHTPSHVHGDLKIRLSFIIKRVSCKNRDYISENLPFSSPIGKKTCVKVTWEDEIVYAIRVGRDHFSKFVKNRHSEPIKNVTIFLKKVQGIYIIMSCYYGQKSERPPNNELSTEENISFWEDHALIWGSEPVYPETVTSINPWTGVDERNTFAEILKGK